MRKHQQRKILELLKTLEEAQSAGLYADCQSGAVSVGNYIESIEGEDTKTVAMLEEYCELLFKASKGEIKEKALRKQLIKIENGVWSELNPRKIEIAFLSYKASMSDSLESVYFAAKADPDCDAYWIPVPYYERRTDGSFGEIRYEGADCYGDNIECTDWREYDIAARHPDVIFTFAPYDNGNFVTSVHPDFYCERLRDLTELLVYIPYFVVTDDVSEHFCTVAGCVYAHKVIVQSEKVRDTYIRVFEKNFGNRFGKPKDKVVALGSPKFDKVINAKREDFILPDEWRERIGNRKVILYNTSVGAILRGSERYLNKLRNVFDIFRERDDAVLWWRPHPLSNATYQSMHPQLADEYERIVAQFNSEGFGIYDATPDLHRAIVWSDVYYGDRSSLVALYQTTGKPVMIQCINNVPENECFRALAFENLYDDGEFLWFTAYNFNALFRMDKQTWETEFMGSFPEESPSGWRLYGTIIEHNGRLFFAPRLADAIAVYDIKTKAFSRIELDVPKDAALLPNNKFSSAVFYKKWIYFIPSKYPSIVRFDVETGELSYYSDWVEPLTSRKKDAINVYFRNSVAIGKYIYAAASRTNAVLVFDMDSQTSVIHTVGNEDCCFLGIGYDGKDFWLSPRNNGTIIKWNEKNNKAKSLQPNLPDLQWKGNAYLDIVCVGDDIFVFPLHSNKALKIGIESETVTESDIFQPECEREQTNTGISNANYIMGKVIGDVIYAHTGKSNRFIAYNVKTGAYQEASVFPNNAATDSIKSLIRHRFFRAASNWKEAKNCLFHETGGVELNDYLDYFVRDYDSKTVGAIRDKELELIKSSIKYADGSCGAAIFSYCRKAIEQ